MYRVKAQSRVHSTEVYNILYEKQRDINQSQRQSWWDVVGVGVCVCGCIYVQYMLGCFHIYSLVHLVRTKGKKIIIKIIIKK